MGNFPRIKSDRAVMSGLPCLRETHVTVATVVALIAAGRSESDVLRMFPSLTLEDIREGLAYAAWAIDELEHQRQASADKALNGSKAIPETEAPVVPEPAISQPASLFSSEEQVPSTPPEEDFLESEPVEAENETQPVSELENEEESLEKQDETDRLELYHPGHPDSPTVIVGREGLLDKRWRIPVVAWCDIEKIERVQHEKTIVVTLRNPKSYLSCMPLLGRLEAKFRLALNLPYLFLDTASLGIRTTHLYYTASRFWMRHRGDIKVRRKYRKRIPQRKVTVLTDDFANKEFWS